MHLEKVAHHVREKLDEIKRKEVNRLRVLAKERMKEMQGTDVLKLVAQFGGMLLSCRFSWVYSMELAVCSAVSIFDTVSFPALLKTLTEHNFYWFAFDNN